jgi:hypothetical protein
VPTWLARWGLPEGFLRDDAVLALFLVLLQAEEDDE